MQAPADILKQRVWDRRPVQGSGLQVAARRWEPRPPEGSTRQPQPAEDQALHGTAHQGHGFLR